jgi:hypothetical protein
MEKVEKRNWDAPRRGRKIIPDKKNSKLETENNEDISVEEISSNEEDRAIYLAWKAAQVSANK